MLHDSNCTEILLTANSNIMEDLFKKFLYTGVGLVSHNAELLQKNLNELIEKGKLTEEEGRKVVDDLVDDTNHKKEEFEDRLRGMVDSILKKVDLPSREELSSLKSRIAELEEELAATRAKDENKTTTTAKKKP
jgi:polyhydroxyalkanoate synthesis regulator phasin